MPSAPIGLIQAVDISATIANQLLFENLSFSLRSNSRVGLVGTNGSGKSTLLKILGGIMQPDHGELVKRRDLHVEYVSQFVPPELKDTTLFAACFQNAEKRNADAQEWQVEIKLGLFGFEDKTFEIPFGDLSGGEANRALLARAMCADPTLLLLDEPTNHLDSEGIIHFEKLLHEKLKIPYCLVSHDRVLLDSCTTETLFLRDKRIYHFEVPFSDARIELENMDAAARHRRTLEIKEVDRLKAAALRMQRWASMSADNAPRYRAMLTRLERAKSHITFVSRDQAKDVALGSVKVRADSLVRVENLPVTVGDNHKLFDIDSFSISPGDRAVILGKNGAGKTTFLKHLVSAFNGQNSSSIVFNPQVRLGYYDQELCLLNPARSLLEHFAKSTRLPETEYRKELVVAGFPFHQQDKKISELSGGERARLQFLTLKMLKPTLFVLDEPTNHIDVQGIETLEDEMLSAETTCLFVSHDRRFVQNVANRFFLIIDGNLREISGVEPYYELLNKKDEVTINAPSTPIVSQSTTHSVQTTEQIMDSIAQLEGQLATLDPTCKLAKQLTQRISSLYESLYV